MTVRFLAGLALLIVPATSQAQGDAVSLDALHRDAIRLDPRSASSAALSAASTARLEVLRRERLPQLKLNASTSYQTDVTRVAFATAGTTVPEPLKARWDATASVDQVIYDGGTLAEQQRTERAKLAEQLADIDATLYRRRADVNAAFFTAWLAQQRGAELRAAEADLDGRLSQARARVAAATALPADTARLLAAKLDLDDARALADADQAAALAILSTLTGRSSAALQQLILPQLDAAVATARRSPPRARPEFAQFQAQRHRLDRQIAQFNSINRPRAVGFAQGGLGRPGLNQFGRSADPFATVGLRIEWRPWTWGSAGLQQRALQDQQAVIGFEEQAFTDLLERTVQQDLVQIDRLHASQARDAQRVALREVVERTARVQFDEAALTAADYLDARTDLLQASLERDRHRVELAQAQARYLTTLGLAPR